MQTKLTLRLDDRLIKRAKRHAAHRGKSLSQLVSELFGFLDGPNESEESLGPVTTRLRGVLSRGSKTDYRRHLEDKYG